MSKRRNNLFVLTALCFFSTPLKAGILEEIGKIFGGHSSQSSLNEGEIVKGLKEALLLGVKRATSYLGEVKNLLQNAEPRIPPPPKLAKVAKFLRKVGFEKQVEDFERGLNAAAAQAVREDYFRQKTSPELYEKFRPLVREKLLEVGVTQKYQNLFNSPYARRYLKETDLDLEHYVTQATLDRLFKLLVRGEKRIRRDPAARPTELLKKVFGQRN